MLPRQRYIFLNRYRLRRSLIIGTILTLLFYHPFTGKEALSIGMLAALVVDAVLFCRTAWSLDYEQTKALFDHERLRPGLLIKSTVAINFLGLGVMSLCISDLGSKQPVLPEDLRIFIYFVSILLIWISLHHGYAMHYAKIFFHVNADRDDAENAESATKVFSFPDDRRPVLFDFLYVAHAIGMTFGMTDVGAQSTEIRKVVLVQAMLAFLFATTAISAIASLFTA